MFYLDVIPLILAIIAVYISAKKYEKAIYTIDKNRIAIRIIIAIILIIAQTSLLVSIDILQKDEDISFASHLWVLFNSIAMILIIIYPLKEK